MSPRPRSIVRALVAALALVAAGLAAAAWVDRRPPRGLLPDGAAFAVEATAAAETLDRLEDTRFAAAFVAGPTYSWLEQSEPVRAIDELRTGIGNAIGFTPQRRHLLELAGSDAAAAWYPLAPSAPQGQAVPWLAAGRLSLTAWPVAAVARLALRLGFGAGVSRDRVGNATVLAVGAGEDALRLFFSGRLLVASNDRTLIERAARLAADGGPSLPGAAEWRRVFSHLPERGELRLWARGELLPRWASSASATATRAAGAVVSARSPVTIDLFVDAPDSTPQESDRDNPPPALALAGTAPLLFHSSGGPLPPLLLAQLDDRVAAVARRSGSAAPARPALGRGFALAVTAVEEGGLFPRPNGILAVGMRDAEASRRALGMLFPVGARSAAGRWGTAFSTRESLPLAGEFELWGAAAGDRLVLATQLPLIEGLAEQTPTVAGVAGADDDRPLDSITTLNVTKLLPALRRYAPPLAGFLRARYRGVPDVSRDFELLAAVRSVAVTAATSPAGTLSRVTLDVGDLPAAR